MALPQASPSTHSKFSVYQNAAVASALASRRLKPSFSSFVVIIMISFLSIAGLVASISREQALIKIATETGAAQSFAFVCVRALQSVAGVIFLAALSALWKALSLQITSDVWRLTAGAHAEQKKEYARKSGTSLSLSEHQQVLLGLSEGKHKRQAGNEMEVFDSPVRHRPPRTTFTTSPSQAILLAPVHTPSSAKNSWGAVSPLSSWTGGDWGDAHQPSPPISMQSAPYVCLTQNQASPIESQSSPWPKSTSPLLKEDIATEDKLEEFLADVDEKLVEPAVKTPTGVQSLLTPPPNLRGVRIATPTSMTGTPGSASKGTPVRTLRISPSPQKFESSPRKGDGDLPPPMTPEQAEESFEKLGVYPQIEQWRDRLRQWFSKHLLNPLVLKLDSSHLQVMQAAAKLGISVNVSPAGGTEADTVSMSQSRVDAPVQDWVSPFPFDEDALLHQLRVYLLQARDSSPAPLPSALASQQHQIRPVNPAIQEFLDAVSEHQCLKALMKGEWAKGLLPQSSVRTDYTVQRIRELAEGTCVKKYEYLATGEMYDKIAKRWRLELPTDSHLLIYLFCALLEHPNWMLHVDPASQPSIQSANNPLFVVHVPHKERCPERHVAVLAVPPPFLHPEACVLSVGKQNPPVFALYWEKRLQFSLQGRTALWDAVLLFCYRIKASHGGVVQGTNLGSSAFNLLSVLQTLEGEKWAP